MLEKNVRLCEKKVLITGAAGFIGANLAMKLLCKYDDIHIIGLDNMNTYYDVALKQYRLNRIQKMLDSVSGKFVFVQGSISDKKTVQDVFREHEPDVVVNLAAQAGVRYSIDHPDEYIESNLIGFYNILEACRHSYASGRKGVEHLVYASSSSIYGSNDKIPYSVEDKTDCPVSLYAATKKSNELLAYAYCKLYGIPATGLRFFTVYGPAGRPDMAYFSFTERLVNNENIKIFNYGNCKRDFTYIDDTVIGVEEIMQRSPLPDKSGARHKVYNIGNSHPESLLDFVHILQEELQRAGVLSRDYDFDAHIELVEMQPGDVEITYADTSELERDTGFKPVTDLRTGLRSFAEWYRDFNQRRRELY